MGKYIIKNKPIDINTTYFYVEKLAIYRNKSHILENCKTTLTQIGKNPGCIADLLTVLSDALLLKFPMCVGLPAK